MKLEILNKIGEKVDEMTLGKAFEYKVSQELLALYINYLRNALRDPIANAKDRSEVSGGGHKPYKQKGTGRSRQGSIRSPLWVGGGVTFGPSSEQNWHQRMSKRMKKQVMAGIIGRLVTEKKCIGIDDLTFAAPKTSEAVEIMTKMNIECKTCVIFSEKDKNAGKSFRNIAGVISMYVDKLNVIDLLSCGKVIITKEALIVLDERYNKEIK
ncbi:MAG: 50S ribosomal protein L4 [Candidatus Berkelbacteria bacterium]